MDVAVVVPTYNERENVALLIYRLNRALAGLRWELIFVDDDSPDGTSEIIAEHARTQLNIRLIHRVGRRGLSSACLEGMLATQAPFVAVMDGDLQHDETILPEMFARLRREPLDVVVGTRNADGGSMGQFPPTRVLLSRLGQRVSTTVCRVPLTDPMSGFFALRRDFLMEVVRGVQGGGFKILVDLLASAPRAARIGEIGYTFAERRHGESKLDMAVGLEYLAMVLNKLLGGLIPVDLTLYLAVGGLGMLVYFGMSLLLIRGLHLRLLEAQSIATLAAMGENFLLNNRFTFRDRRLRGTRLLTGAVNFLLVCSFGAWANLVLTSALLHEGVHWYRAGLCGILLGSVWNLSISSQFTWRARGPRREPATEPCPPLLETPR